MSKKYILVNDIQSDASKVLREYIRDVTSKRKAAIDKTRINKSKGNTLKESQEEEKLRMFVRRLLAEKAVISFDDNEFEEVEGSQNFSNLFDEEGGTEEPPEEEVSEPEQEVDEFEELNRDGVNASEDNFKEIKKQLSDSYSNLSNSRDRTLFQNWFYINTLLLLRLEEQVLIPPRGVQKTDVDEFFKSIDLTKVAEDLEIKTAFSGEEEGPTVDAAAFARDDNNRVSAYDLIDQYVAPSQADTGEDQQVETQPTGINALGEFFKKVKVKIVNKYKTLTSSPEQRKGFIQSLLERTKSEFDQLDAEYKIQQEQ